MKRNLPNSQVILNFKKTLIYTYIYIYILYYADRVNVCMCVCVSSNLKNIRTNFYSENIVENL